MTTPLSWLPLDLVNDLGWTLLHFLWQGFALAVICQIALLPSASSRRRYTVAAITLAAMAAAPVATFLAIHRHAVPAQIPPGVLPMRGALMGASSITLDMDWLVIAWIAGVAVFSLRVFAGWSVAGRLRRSAARPLPEFVLARCQRLARALGVTRPVRFLQSAAINVPVVIGWLRPVVLIPFAALMGLAPEQLDAVIMHELAHIRRLDVLANLIQSVVETALFYHPAVWWVSRQMRTERENCCDDIAVAWSGDALGYARALAAMEEWRGPALNLPAQAMAASGGMLMERIARLLGLRLRPRSRAGFALAAFVLFCLVLYVLAQGIAIAPSVVAMWSLTMLDFSTPVALVVPSARWVEILKPFNLLADLSSPLRLEFDLLIIANVFTIIGYVLTDGIALFTSFARASFGVRVVNIPDLRLT